MKAYAVIPLDRSEETLKALDKGINGINLQSIFPHEKSDLHVRFVVFEGTPTELSKSILKEAQEDYIPHAILSFTFANLAGQGPTDLVQWMQEYVK